MVNGEVDELSERELEILRLVATGVSNKEIARQLFISSNTVKVHLRNIFSKIDANSRTEAAMYAVRIGLVGSEGALQAPTLPGSDATDSQGGSLGLPLSEATTPTWGNLLSSLPRGWAILLVVLLLVGMLVIGLVLARQPGLQAAVAPLPTPTPAPRWHEVAALPTARSGLAVVAYENLVYAIGGETALGVTAQVERFDPESNTWSTLNPKPVPVSDVQAAVIGGLIYVPGGKAASGAPVDILEIYDPRQDRWEMGARLPVAVSAYALVAFEGQLYLFGGWDGVQYLSSVYEYDPGQKTWVERSPMPTARGYAGAIITSGAIQVLGGRDSVHALASNEAYQPARESGPGDPWSLAPEMPFPRYAMGVASMADLIYVIGGISEANEPAVGLEYSPLSNEWQGFDLPIADTWSNLGIATLSPHLYVFGGLLESTPTNLNLRYQAIYTFVIPLVR